MKVCSKCKQEKPLSEFWKARTNKDGHSGEPSTIFKQCIGVFKKTWATIDQRHKKNW